MFKIISFLYKFTAISIIASLCYLFFNYGTVSKDFSNIQAQVKELASLKYKYKYKRLVFKNLFDSKAFNKTFFSNIESYVMKVDCSILKQHISGVKTTSFIGGVYKNYLSFQISCGQHKNLNDYELNKALELIFLRKSIEEYSFVFNPVKNSKYTPVEINVGNIVNSCKVDFKKYPIKNKTKFCNSIYKVIINNYK